MGIGDKVLLLLPNGSYKLLHQWDGTYEIVDIVNRLDYNVKGVVNTYPANMLKQYVERHNVTSYRSAFVGARSKLRSTMIPKYIMGKP